MNLHDKLPCDHVWVEVAPSTCDCLFHSTYAQATHVCSRCGDLRYGAGVVVMPNAVEG
jgi:hypothetical protein